MEALLWLLVPVGWVLGMLLADFAWWLTHAPAKSPAAIDGYGEQP